MTYDFIKFLVVSFCVCMLCSLRASAQKPGLPIDIVRYTYQVELNDTNDSIKVAATIDFIPLKNTESIVLDLVSVNKAGMGMRVQNVTAGGRKITYNHEQDILTIQFPSVQNMGARNKVQIAYDGVPADGLIISKNKYNRRTFFSDHWPNRARNWLACIDHPAEKAAFDFIITAPTHYQVVSNGVMIEETNIDNLRKVTHYQENIPISMKIAAIGVANFAVRYETPVENVSIQTWVYPENKKEGFYDYALATEMLPFFTRNIGPFPFRKLANVQSKTVFGGMENAGAIFYAESSVTGRRTCETLVAHEISHQWFGNMATEADWPHVWLSEGFVSYLAIMYMESKYGKDTAMKMRLEDRTKALNFAKHTVTAIVDTTTNDYLQLLNANTYEKASLVLHMLRKQLGDTIFWQSLRNYYNQFSGRNAVSDDFRRAVEKTSGKDLKSFFQQWIYTAGHPKLHIQWKFDKATKSALVSIQQLQEPLFEFPLELEFTTPGQQRVSRTVAVTQKNTGVSIPLPSQPSGIAVDPNVDLFFESRIIQTR